MEFVHEVTAYLENKPGRLAKICSALAHEKIDIHALSVMDRGERSVLRFVTDDLEPTKKVLNALGTEFTSAEVLAVQMDNRPEAPLAPGSLSGWPRSTSTSSTPTPRARYRPRRTLGIFHTSNPRRALQVLNDSATNGVDRAAGRRPLHTR